MTTITEQEPMTKAKITTPADRQVRIERIFNAPRDRVWQALTDPNLRRLAEEQGIELISYRGL